MSEHTANADANADANATLTPEDALRRVATVTANTRTLRIRTEGLTIAIWGLVLAASYLTLIVPLLGGGPGPDGGIFGGGPRHPPATRFFASRLAPAIWYAIGAILTIAVWRSASLSFQTGITTPRLVAVFAAWMLIFLATIVLVAYVQGGNPRGWHLYGWAVVLGLFAAFNPLRFTADGRLAVAIVAIAALATGIYAQVAGLRGGDVGFLSGIALGAPAIITGTTLMFRG